MTDEFEAIEALQKTIAELDARIREGARRNAELMKEAKKYKKRCDQLTRGLYKVEEVFPEVVEPSAEVLDLFNKVHAVVLEAFTPEVGEES